MLTSNDLQSMREDVASIIDDNASLCEVWTPKPMVEQPGYNPILQEISDESTILYNKLLNVPVDRVDMPGVHVIVDSPAGRKIGGQVFLHFPITYTQDEVTTTVVITYDSIIHIPNGPLTDKWKPKSIKYDRIGEIVVQAERV